MRPRRAWITIPTALALLGLASPCFAEKVDFSRDVLPILSAQCFACHGPDASKRKASLRLDERESAVAQRRGTAAVSPGSPAKSELIRRVLAGDKEGRMPPPKAGPRLTAAQVAHLRRWLEEGAGHAEQRALVPPPRPAGPRVPARARPRSPIDHFVLRRLEAQKVRPAPPASREVLIRRATLDLTGLPPTPEEVEAFIKNTRPDAYERLVDR